MLRRKLDWATRNTNTETIWINHFFIFPDNNFFRSRSFVYFYSVSFDRKQKNAFLLNFISYSNEIDSRYLMGIQTASYVNNFKTITRFILLFTGEQNTIKLIHGHKFFSRKTVKNLPNEMGNATTTIQSFTFCIRASRSLPLRYVIALRNVRELI